MGRKKKQSTDQDIKGRFLPGNSAGEQFQPTNSVALKHGCFSRIALPDLPAELSTIKRSVRSFCLGLERACRETHGEISIGHAAAINSCGTHERFARLWYRRLQENYEKLDDEAVARMTGMIVRHNEGRDRCIAALKLSGEHEGINSGYDIPSFVVAIDRPGPTIIDTPPAGDFEPPPEPPAQHPGCGAANSDISGDVTIEQETVCVDDFQATPQYSTSAATGPLADPADDPPAQPPQTTPPGDTAP